MKLVAPLRGPKYLQLGPKFPNLSDYPNETIFSFGVNGDLYYKNANGESAAVIGSVGTVTFTGDVTGTGATDVVLTLSDSGVVAGSYKSVTVDSKGRVTNGTNPTTLAGYGITDAADLNHTHILENLSNVTIGTKGNTDLLQWTGSSWANSSSASVVSAALTSGMVTTALGFTPYNATNPAGYISGITSGMVTTALGFTPYDSSNPSGYTSNLGTVTSVGATAPIQSTGGTTPVLSMPAATTSVNGYLLSTDWTTFNAKAPTSNPTFTGTVTASSIDSTAAGTLSLGTVNAATVNLGTATSTQTINIGTGSGVTTINIGGAGDTVNISGTLTYVNTTNLQVTDKTITVNKGGAASSGDASGIEVEENATITGYAKVGNSRASWTFKAPARAGSFLLTASTNGVSTEITSSVTANRTYTLPDASGTFALVADLASYEPTIAGGLASQYWNGSKGWTDFNTSVRSSTLTGLAAGTNTAITATDSVLSAFQNIQAQLNGKQTSGSYQPLDADLTAIAALAGTSGILKKTAADTWTLDTSAYSTTTGTVTLVSVATANGFAGTVANAGTTPVLTLTTSVSGLLKGNGTSISAAVAGTDYSSGTSALGTGILKSTTGTGTLSIAVAADFPILNQNTTGNAATVTTNANLTGDVTSVGNTTTLAATTVTGKVLTNYVVGTNTAVAATDTILSAFGKLQAQISANGNGTVSTVSVASSNGFAGSVATATTTPVITITTSISGLLKGNGTAISAAVAGTDYVAPSTAPILTGTNFTGIPNSALTNSSVTIGSTTVALGATSTTLAGLTSVTATTFTGALSGNATTATTAGTVTTAAQPNITSLGTLTTLNVDFATIDTYTLTTTSVTAGQVIASIPQATYRSAEFQIQAVDATGGKYQTTKILAIHNGSTSADYTEYGSVQVGGVTGAFSITADGTNMKLLVTPASANSTVFKVAVTAIKV